MGHSVPSRPAGHAHSGGVSASDDKKHQSQLQHLKAVAYLVVDVERPPGARVDVLLPA